MRRVYIALLTVMFCLASMLPAPARAVVNRVLCQPGDMIYAVFALAEDGDQPNGVMCKLSYDHDIFSVLPSPDLIEMEGISILNMNPAVVAFRVSKYAPAGQYAIEAIVLEAVDADGKKYENVQIIPVMVKIEDAAADGSEDVPAPASSKPSMENGRKQIAAGDYVTFGHYPQTAEGNDHMPIEWLVLAVQGNKALLLSRYGLDAGPYHARNDSVTWENCTLRKWLNEEFLKKAFSDSEQQAIVLTQVDNNESQGYTGWSALGENSTQDKIFLLSYAEANAYLGVQHYTVTDSGKNIKARIAPTSYAESRGASTSRKFMTDNKMSTGWWWLRSPGTSLNRAAHIRTSGALSSDKVSREDGMICPVLWVDLESGIFE